MTSEASSLAKQDSNAVCDQSALPGPVWRQQLARVVEEVFQVTQPEHWDLLIDLREGVLRGERWEDVLDQFQSCRDQLEQDHYLVFYRMRRILESQLRLEVTVGGQGEVRHQVLRLWAYRQLRRALRQAEKTTAPDGSRWVCRVVEKVR